ncbi:unnamed protein product, partial [Owenia fusiformis]
SIGRGKHVFLKDQQITLKVCSNLHVWFNMGLTEWYFLPIFFVHSFVANAEKISEMNQDFCIFSNELFSSNVSFMVQCKQRLEVVSYFRNKDQWECDVLGSLITINENVKILQTLNC